MNQKNLLLCSTSHPIDFQVNEIAQPNLSGLENFVATSSIVTVGENNCKHASLFTPCL